MFANSTLLALLVSGALASWNSNAATVAFMEIRNADGQTVQLEPNGRFWHVAIEVGGRWLHAYPGKGVHFSETLKRYGRKIVYLEDPNVPEPDASFVEKWLGKPFDTAFRWETETSMHCSRLPALWLGCTPKSVQFAGEPWARASHWDTNQLGLSPDDLYAELLARGFKPKATECSEELEMSIGVKFVNAAKPPHL